MKILAIDLGNRKSVACIYDSSGKELGYKTIQTRPDQFQELYRQHRPDRLVIEISPLAGWVHDGAREAGVREIEVANTNEDAWRWKHVKRKTDRRDALKLAQLSAMNQLKTVYIPKPEVRQWRSLIEYRDTLMNDRVAIQNRIRGLLTQQAIVWPRGRKGWTRQMRKQLQSMARPLTEADGADTWRGTLAIELHRLEQVEEHLCRVEEKLEEIAAKDRRVQLVRTIPGVGIRGAETIVASLDDPHRFSNGRKVSAYAGMVPRQFQSGDSDRSGKITKDGRALLRKMLVEVAWIALRHNPWLRRTYERIHRGSKTRKKKAIVAVGRRLLVMAWAMMRDGTVWSPPEETSEPATTG